MTYAETNAFIRHHGIPETRLDALLKKKLEPFNPITDCINAIRESTTAEPVELAIDEAKRRFGADDIEGRYAAGAALATIGADEIADMVFEATGGGTEEQRQSLRRVLEHDVTTAIDKFLFAANPPWVTPESA